MIKAAQRAKPKVKRQGEADGAADAEKQKIKRRRPTQKKREADEAESEAGMLLSTEHIVPVPYDGVELLESPARLHEAQTVYLDQMYERAPRELPPDAPTIRSLTMTEIQSDLRRIQQAMNKFENRLTTARAADPPSAEDSEDDLAGMPYGNMLRDRRMARENGVVAPEEVVETVPAARRAVKITERELKALKRERDDLERDFMRLRSTYIWQVAEMKRMQKQQDQAMRALSREVIRKAKSLESSRRRTSALQDIMTELESRGNTIKRLTREKDRLESLLEKHEIELPEIDEVYIGDRVKCAPFGHGKVAALNPDTRIITVDLEFGARGYIHEDDVEMLPSDITYLEVEEQLKLRLFEKVGALVRPNGKFSMLGTQSSSRSRVRIDSDDDFDDDEDSEDESMEDEDETSEDDGENAQNEDDDSMSGKGRESNAQDDVISQLKKKRKLIMNTPSSSGGSKKKTKQQQKVINFPATTLPITPYENGLLVSPLSTLPERVAAAGPNALQWLPSYLPKNMNEWEQERYQSLQMKGEIERLRFQLQKAEAEKLDAQQHASDQVESINQLVVQLEKLRESNGASSSASQASPPEGSNAEHTCPNCGEGTTSVRKNSSASNKSGKSADGAAAPAPRANTRKGAASKRASDSGGEEEDDSAEKEKKSSAGEDGADDESKKSKSQDEDEDDGESSDAATSKARATRSLRPRRSKRS